MDALMQLLRKSFVLRGCHMSADGSGDDGQPVRNMIHLGTATNTTLHVVLFSFDA